MATCYPENYLSVSTKTRGKGKHSASLCCWCGGLKMQHSSMQDSSISVPGGNSLLDSFFNLQIYISICKWLSIYRKVDGKSLENRHFFVKIVIMILLFRRFTYLDIV